MFGEGLRVRGIFVMTDEELREAIRVARPEFERKVAAGEIVVRGSLTYAKKGPSVGGLPKSDREG
jgi:hypothetical protein